MNDVFHCVERDVHFVRDVRLWRVMRLRAWVEHITSLLRSKSITVQQHNITCPLGQTSLYKDEPTYKMLNEQCASIRVMLIASCKTVKSHKGGKKDDGDQN